jgi:hypothetical protein
MDFEGIEGIDSGLIIGGKNFISSGTVRDVGIDFTRLFYMLYQQMDSQIMLADSKAQLIITANAIIIASFTLDQGAIRRILAAGTSLPDRIGLGLSVAMIVCIMLSVFYALATTRPNLAPPSQVLNLFFWGHIAQVPEAEYREKFMNMSIDEVKLSVITQIHARSRVVARKFRRVQRSLDFLFISLVLYLLTYIVQGIA